MINTNDLKNIKEWKYVSEYNGSISYLIVDYKNKTISDDFYEYNGGHRPCEMVKLKELKRLKHYFLNIVGYKLVD